MSQQVKQEEDIEVAWIIIANALAWSYHKWKPDESFNENQDEVLKDDGTCWSMLMSVVTINRFLFFLC